MDGPTRRQLDAHLAALADGDRSAFEPVFSLCLPLVRRYAERALAGSADTEDVVQSALTRLFARASEYDASRPALPFVLGIVANEVRTHRRRGLRRREEPIAREPVASASTPEECAVERELLATAFAVLDGLSALDREAIAAALGAAPRPDVDGATFRKRLSRALGRLRHAFGEVHDG